MVFSLFPILCHSTYTSNSQEVKYDCSAISEVSNLWCANEVIDLQSMNIREKLLLCLLRDNTELRCSITFLWVVSLLFNYTSAHILPWPNDNNNMNNPNPKCISRFYKLFSTFHILDDACVSNTPEWGSICSSVSDPLSHFTFLCFQIIVRATASSNKNPPHMHKVRRGFSLNLNYLFLNKGIWTKMKHKWLVRLYPAPLLIEFSLALKLPAAILWASVGGKCVSVWVEESKLYCFLFYHYDSTWQTLLVKERVSLGVFG